MKVSRMVSKLLTQTVGWTIGWSYFTKGYNSIKTVDFMVLNLCTLFGDALYLHQVSRKYLKGFQIY